MTGDRDPYRAATAAAVLLVAAIAATVSYVHIESLAIRYGQPQLAAWLLPLSIDGTVATSSLAMLRAARAGLSAPWLARGMLLLAVAATLACNVGYGLPHGWPGALLSGWPAVAFVGCAEVAISMSRRRPARGHPGQDKPAATVASPAANGHQPPGQAARVARPSTADTEAAALAALAGNPAMTHKQLAAEIGTSERTARRVRRPAGQHGSHRADVIHKPRAGATHQDSTRPGSLPKEEHQHDIRTDRPARQTAEPSSRCAPSTHRPRSASTRPRPRAPPTST